MTDATKKENTAHFMAHFGRKWRCKNSKIAKSKVGFQKFYNIVLLKIVLLLLIVYVFSLVINQDFWRYIMFQDRMSVRNLVVFSAI